MGENRPFKTPKGNTNVALRIFYFHFWHLKWAEWSSLPPKVAESLRNTCYQINTSVLVKSLSNDVCTGVLLHGLTHLAFDFLLCFFECALTSFFFYLLNFFAAYHHQSAVETSGGATVGEEPDQVARKRKRPPRLINSLTTCQSPISLTESFPHKLGWCDTQCAEMLLLHWWGFTLLASVQLHVIKRSWVLTQS